MKIHHPVILGLVAFTLAGAYGQGKGGGNNGGPGPGGNKGGGFDRPPVSSNARPVTPDSTPGRSSERPGKPEHPHATADTGKGKADRAAAGAAQDLSGSMHTINQTAFAQRKALHDTLDMRLQSSRDAVKKVQAEAKNQRIDARADFKSSLADVKKRETDLSEAMKAARKADEAGWSGRREALARAYQNHADAVGRLESIPRLPRP